MSAALRFLFARRVNRFDMLVAAFMGMMVADGWSAAVFLLVFVTAAISVCGEWLLERKP